MRSESIAIPISNSESLHLQRFFQNPEGPVVLMLHGAIENGRIFYSANNKGLAPYLARNGMDVYVADLRGRGLSLPSISRRSRFSQTDSIQKDIPAYTERIRQIRGDIPQHWVAHSWGGVLMLAALARLNPSPDRVASLTLFASKRSVRVWNFEKFLKIDLFWKTFARALIRVYGYLPAKEWGIGSDNESDLSHLQSKIWVKPSAWVDPEDGFDYAQALRSIQLPRSLYLAGARDKCLGHPKDVQDFMRETGDSNAVFRLLSVQNGNRKDYGHIDILTNPVGETDHFPIVLDWLRH